MKSLVLFVLIFVLVVRISSYKTFSALNSIVFTNIPTPKENVHSEYYFGKCATRYRELLIHDHFTSDQIRGSLIVRGFLNITDEKRTPNCVYIRATSPYGDMVRYNAYKFSVCFVKIVHNYRGEIFTYHSYEWFIPVEMQEGIDWDVYFFHV